eukprot:CAMPEP_0201589998 /NCGR_PEP_ID=MMETSP0190_2-20130828/173014_1 /ASSEMBLY_ACC=CAM_ASM_000263 /TAXON_ID=37353 /ORGANISM="Rosalina sp." /LENGTH=603 /DNA_ID=CAMNT_0048045257 /DNA_START=23 /DNA_END=1834 /DNA_ORIENTATION=-
MSNYTVSPRKINLIIHFGEEEIPLVIYRGTSEQAIFENIRDLTNLYRFRCLNKKKQPVILSSNLPDKTHIFVVDPLAKEPEPSDEPTPEEQIDYLKPKLQEVIDAKNVLNVFKTMLINLEAPPPKTEESKDGDAKPSDDNATEDAEKKEAGDQQPEEPKKEDAEATTEEAPKTDEAPTDETKEEPKPDDAAAGDENKEAGDGAAAEKKDGDDAAANPNEEEKKVEEEAPDPKNPKYEGKYKALIDEIEGKIDDLQAVIMGYYELSDDLLPPKPEPEPEDAANLAEEAGAVELTQEQKDEALLAKLVTKLQPNMQQQIQQMQQLLQMQQMAMMAMLANSGGGGGGAGGVAVAASPMAGGGGVLPLFNAQSSFLGAPPLGAGQQPSGLPQSATEEAKAEVKEEPKEPEKPDRTTECKRWFGSSKLIEDDEYETLLSFFDNDGSGVKSMELIYKASENEFGSEAFHDKCDDQGPTLFICQSEHEHIFGGFTKESWKDTSSNRKGAWKEDVDAFIFILRSPKDDVLPERWKVLNDKKDKTIKADARFGPQFGYGYDIRICNECNTVKESSSQIDNDDACFGAPKDDDYLTGEFYFLVKDYEMYKVNM